MFREAQENGEFAQAFWLCAQCCQSMEALGDLKIAEQLNVTINQLYQETTQRLERALEAVCGDFKSDYYGKVGASSCCLAISLHETGCSRP